MSAAPDAGPHVAAAVDAARALLGDARTELERLVRIPSISSMPEHDGDVRASADATADLLVRTGLEQVRILDVEGAPPAVVGEWLRAGDAPTVLLYAHHDVQPPGVVERWASAPFEPVERDGRLYGRGTSDDKAGIVAHTTAIAAWLRAAGALPCNVRVLVEGEEEIGSPHLGAFLDAHLDALRADVLVLADAGNWAVGVPGITTSLRGLVDGVFTLRSLEGPVHSGLAAGVAPDPVLAMSRMIASLVDERGEAAIDGLWDDVPPLDDDDRRRLAALPGDARSWAEEHGVVAGALVGDPDVTVWERLWFRPAVSVVGVDAHPIRGSSNQVLASASARVSVRIAPGQDPRRVQQVLRDHLARRVPWGLELTFQPGHCARPWRGEAEGAAFAAAEAALAEAFGVPPVRMGVGGTIPFVDPIVQAFGGVPALLVGPGDPETREHGENESLHLEGWRMLIESEVRMLDGLGRLPRPA